ncbi:nitrogenase iron-molybdenum cofactor biosynthesis protein NifE, partial [Rhizobium ruizarguesonis]
RKSTARDKERIKQMLKDENHLHQSMAASELYAMLREHKPDIMLSGGRTQFVSLEAKIPWLDVNQQRKNSAFLYEQLGDAPQ